MVGVNVKSRIITAAQASFVLAEQIEATICSQHNLSVSTSNSVALAPVKPHLDPCPPFSFKNQNEDGIHVESIYKHHKNTHCLSGLFLVLLWTVKSPSK